jgi:hypothetical protein
MSTNEMLAVGFLGGLIPDIVRIVGLRLQGMPSYMGTWFFWVSLIVLGVLGSLACWLVNPTAVIEAFAVGYSAPSILTRLGGDGAKGLTGDRSDDREADRQRQIEQSRPRSLVDWWTL